MRKVLFAILLLIVFSFGFVGYTDLQSKPTMSEPAAETEQY
ncbi:hypothetical protein [Halobacillus shinanisalinarum]|nr:hypothetical protein [Halobacillus shinanisalinarum]